MAVILQIDFPFQGPFGEEMAKGMEGLAHSIINEPGCLWKIWTENEADQIGGGIYLFEDRASAQAYLDMHSARLGQFGVPSMNAKILDINEGLSKITKAPFNT
jgi:hypothetical protein